MARDLDLLRRAVDDRQLTYVGTSYGTHLGEVYANLFPQRVRAMALDGVLQPEDWTTGRQPGQGDEPYVYRLGSARPSAPRPRWTPCCEFGGPDATEQSLHRKYDELLATLRRGPITYTDSHGEKQQITYQELVGRMPTALYGADAATYIGPFLQVLYLATRHPAAAAAARIPTQAQPRFSDEPQSADNAWHNAVACTDSDNPRDPREVGRYARLADRLGDPATPYEAPSPPVTCSPGPACSPPTSPGTASPTTAGTSAWTSGWTVT
ncbi:alpha/beta hydrolase fold [Amycolatopsis saalfeldensis]|uniref:Alpha/beta hydrolase fold n=1 Tax=Amycolatopsis saalfeldensis TaxID=394193 RepID=A0A1H8RR00_9PSEU|nr:alpha/beta hydrolase fold [Amycolatopsis saalfeldensis]